MLEINKKRDPSYGNLAIPRSIVPQSQIQAAQTQAWLREMKITPEVQVLTKEEAQRKGALIRDRLSANGHDTTPNGWFMTELQHTLPRASFAAASRAQW